ncbi:MAG: putative membrane protein [Arcticibacterium sp.]|jgi:uncharacterized membrane protein
MILLDLTTFLGRLHPLVVHLPIGFLLLAALFDWASYFPKYKNLSAATDISLLLGTVSAAGASFLGWLLSTGGDYSYSVLNNHKWGGIWLAVFSLVLYFSSHTKVKQYFTIPQKVKSGIYAGLVLLMSYVGHQGGNLTHGTEYLTLATLTETPREKPDTMEHVLIFEDVVEPILEKKCIQCHRSDKKKGELVMSSHEGIFKGGKGGSIIDKAHSELIRRVTLDPADEEFMPTDGKTPLTRNEIEILKWWVAQGAIGEDAPFLSLTNYESIQPRIGSYLGFMGFNIASEEQGTGQQLNPNLPKNVDPSHIATLVKNGFRVRKMNLEPLMLDISIEEKFRNTNIDLKLLEPLAESIVWLNIAKCDLANDKLAILPQFKNIEKLRLEHNPISDDALKYVSSLTFLNAINLNETKITAAGLSQTKDLALLKNIYVWKTSIGKEEAQQFERTHEGVQLTL